MKSLIPALVVLALVSVSAQEKEIPNDSTRVSIPGCSRGNAFVVTASPEPIPGVPGSSCRPSFPADGREGNLLNEIKKREGKMIEVTGLVKKSELRESGIRLGGGRVRIGGGSPQAPVSNGPGPGPAEGVAILDVEGWRPLAETCPS